MKRVHDTNSIQLKAFVGNEYGQKNRIGKSHKAMTREKKTNIAIGLCDREINDVCERAG